MLGASMPALGFGTWQDKDAQEEAVAIALKNGYRHIDTAHIYGTEPMVAAGIKKSGVPRDQIFITTKYALLSYLDTKRASSLIFITRFRLWNNRHDPKSVEKSLDDSLKALDVDYVDLYLMHWPSPFKDGENKFPKDENEKVIPGDADYVDT